MTEITKRTLRIFWQHLKRYKTSVIATIMFITLVVAGNLVRPFLIKDLFDTLALGPDSEVAGRLLTIILIIIGIALWHTVLWRVINFILNYFAANVMSDLLNTSYRYLQNHSVAFFDNNFVGSIVAKTRRLSSAFERFVDNMVYDIYPTALRIIAIVAILLWYRPIIGVAMLGWVVLYLVVAFIFAKYKLPLDLEKVEQDTKTTGHLADTITNHNNIKLFASYDREVKAFERITAKLTFLRKRSWDIAQYQETVQALSMVLLEFVVMFIAYRLWRSGELTVGDFAFFQAYLVEMFNHLWNIGHVIRSSYESIADANEMTELLEIPHQIVDADNATDLVVKKGAVSFNNVTFAYLKGQPVLDKLNLQIAPGERIALVGESGGGKSTTIKTLLRFIDIDSGSIEIDGQNIAKVTQSSLRSQVSLVPQEPILFHRSLMDNIRYGKPDATDQEVIAAAKAAHCDEFISGFEQGYQTLVGERGVKLSGGERQRVAIARAILKNAPILVLDEATSSLDSESEGYIQDALHSLMKGKTTIVIAHRLSTIREMDRIIVIEGGKIREEGQHDELLKAEQGIYQKLWDIQVGGFASEK